MKSVSTLKLLLLTFFIFLISLPQQTYAAAPVKPWTILIFLNGHNNLDSFGAEDINEMERIGSTSQFNVVVQWASLNNGSTKRLLIAKDNDDQNVTSPVVQTLAPVDMGNYKELSDFMKWGAKNFPAQHYFVGIWNHGSGWRGVEPLNHSFSKQSSKGISFDDLTGHYITTPQMRLAFEDFQSTIGQKIDVVGTDACLMGMIEVAFELRKSTQYFVASQELEAGDGWPYDVWLNLFRSLKNNDAKVMAESLVKAYNFSYRPDSDVTYPDEAATLSAMDLSKIDGLAANIKDFSEKVISEPLAQSAKILNAVETAYSYSEADYKDLYDVIKKIMTAVPTDKIKAQGKKVMDSIKDVVFISRAQASHRLTKGLSIWVPSEWQYSDYKADYNELQIDSATMWSRMIEFINR